MDEFYNPVILRNKYTRLHLKQLNNIILLNSSKLLYDWRSVSQYVLLSSPLWDLWPDITSCLKVAVLSLWGALSDGRTSLHFQRWNSYRRTQCLACGTDPTKDAVFFYCCVGRLLMSAVCGRFPWKAPTSLSVFDARCHIVSAVHRRVFLY
jgi:hypothetical protein